MMAAGGLLLAGSKAETYYANPYFHLKLVLLALVGMHALAFRSRCIGLRNWRLACRSRCGWESSRPDG